MNRDEFYAAIAPHDDARLRKILWTVYWRGNAQLRERIEDELRPQDQPKVKPEKELPDPVGVLDEVTTFVELAKDGAYMAGDRRVHHTERSKWRHTFRRLAADAQAALTASDPVPAQLAVAKIVDLACDMKRYDYFHSDDPVEAAPSGRAPCTEPSMRPVTGAKSGRTTLPRGTKCSSTGSPALPRTNCWTGSWPARRSPDRNFIFLRARIAERRSDVSQAATLVAKCLKEMPGRQACLDFAVQVGAERPSRAREIAAERARAAEYLRTT